MLDLKFKYLLGQSKCLGGQKKLFWVAGYNFSSVRSPTDLQELDGLAGLGLASGIHRRRGANGNFQCIRSTVAGRKIASRLTIFSKMRYPEA